MHLELLVVYLVLRAAAGVEGAAADADGADLPGAGGVGGVCALTAVRVKALRLAKANTESLK